MEIENNYYIFSFYLNNENYTNIDIILYEIINNLDNYVTKIEYNNEMYYRKNSNESKYFNIIYKINIIIK